MALLIEAGQMTASDYVPTYPDLLLASEGAFSNRASAVNLYLASRLPGVMVLSAVGNAAATSGTKPRCCKVHNGLS
jgi:hypothetical protein